MGTVMKSGWVMSLGATALMAATLSAQTPLRQPPVAPPQPPSTPVPAPTPAILPLPPIDQRPEALLQAQQLAFSAYPELRTKALQVRVEEGSGGPIVTYAEAGQDGADLLARSRPRPALLVIETAFDASHTLTRAVLRGALAHSAERRRVRAMASGWSAALDREGAAFAPTRQTKFVDQLDLTMVKPLVGSMTRQGTQFQTGPEQEGLYWEVAATTAAGESVTLGFEPYAGRLVRFVKGGLQ